MKDIDFDELDRAVASALGSSGPSSSPQLVDDTPHLDTGAPQPTPDTPMISSDDTVERSDVTEVASSDDEPVRSISAHSVHARIIPHSESTRTVLARPPVSESPVDDTPVNNEPEPQLETETSAPVASITKRTIPHRAGRFMDVVPANQRPTRNTMVRTGVLIQPTSSPDASSGTTRTIAAEPVQAGISPGVLIGGGREPVANKTAVSSADVMPADSVEQVSEKLSLYTPVVESSQLNQQEVLIAASLEAPLPESSTSLSPFLPGAKVDKRPLGGLEMHEGTSTDDLGQTATGSNEPHHLEDDADDVLMPAELQSDLAAIDSQEAGPVREIETPSPQVVPSVTSSTTPQPVHAGPTSITRQYKEQPRVASEDDESGSIFDPQTYQPPVEHPAKTSSGWGWVIAILIIIVLVTLAAVVAWMEGILPIPL